MTEKGLRFLSFFQLLTVVTISEYGKEPSDGSVIPCRNYRPAVTPQKYAHFRPLRATRMVSNGLK
jgi:hypothetical protein